PVNDRCIALRATCPSAAVMVKGIQSVAMLIMGDWAYRQEMQPGCRARSLRATFRIACDTNHIVVPANAGTHNPGRQREAPALNQQIAEITPFKIVALDQF